MFIGREQELADLGQEFRHARASLAIVYGRVAGNIFDPLAAKAAAEIKAGH